MALRPSQAPDPGAGWTSRALAHRKRPLTRGVMGTAGLRSAATVFGFLVSLLLARVLGAAGYGVYAYSMAWVEVLAVVAVMGVDRLLVREAAANVTLRSWGILRGLLDASRRAVLLASVLLALVAATVALLAVPEGGSEALVPFCVSLLYLPPVALTRVRQAALQGLRHILLGQVAENLVRPALFAGLVVISVLVSRSPVGVTWVLLMNAAAVTVSLAVAGGLLRRHTPPEVREAEPRFLLRPWARSAFYLLFVGGILVFNTRIGTIMLGSIRGADSVGVFALATQVSWFVLFAQFTVNTAIAPTLAGFHAARDRRGMQRVATKAARVSFAGAFLSAAALTLFGRWLLSLFGAGFPAGYGILVALSAGLMIGSAAGPVIPALLMTGNERKAAAGTAAGAAVNVLLCALLVPRWSAAGAASAAIAANLVRTVWFVAAVRKETGIDPTVLGRAGGGESGGA